MSPYPTVEEVVQQCHTASPYPSSGCTTVKMYGEKTKLKRNPTSSVKPSFAR